MQIVYDDTLNDCIARAKEYMLTVKYASGKMDFYEYAGKDSDNWDNFIYVPSCTGMSLVEYDYIGTMSIDGDGFQNTLKLKRFKRFEGIGK